MTNNTEKLEKDAVLRLLEIKDSEIRITSLEQGFSAIDKGIHIGGAYSAVIPMVSLFYGGFISLDVGDPTRIGQDMFVLSKGHAVAAMASIYADLGYFDSSILTGSRAVHSLLNGHPGPSLPGVQIATGPLGQGFAAAQGFAIAGKGTPAFDVFCMTGDGELQEGVVWEAIMHAPQKKLDNLCVLIDKNEGQLDDSTKLAFSMKELPAQIEAFGWRVFDTDGSSYEDVTQALEVFRRSPRDGRPTAIICNTRKGFGAFSSLLNKHKVTLTRELYEQEMASQKARRDARESEFLSLYRQLDNLGGVEIPDRVKALASRMNLSIEGDSGAVRTIPPRLLLGHVPPRDKVIKFNLEDLPRYKKNESVSANSVITDCMKIFARDPRVVSIDSDLSSTSGLQTGIGHVDQQRALNVGIAEANMMCIGEALAALGNNVWVSTFCPFFNWNVMRRIAVGEQERREAMADKSGWLSDGHSLDITFLATAANLDTAVNGATHMGNDDVTVFGAVSGLKIIDVSCPNQLVSILRWIMEGGKGLIYLRIMRSASGVLYEPEKRFVYGKAARLQGKSEAAVHLVSSGRGVHELLSASALLEKSGVSASVYDMPSFDPDTMNELIASNAIVVIAEQNNGMIWNELGKSILRDGGTIDRSKVLAVNTQRDDGFPQYIHSATYNELIRKYRLDPEQLADLVRQQLSGE